MNCYGFCLNVKSAIFHVVCIFPWCSNLWCYLFPFHILMLSHCLVDPTAITVLFISGFLLSFLQFYNFVLFVQYVVKSTCWVFNLRVCGGVCVPRMERQVSRVLGKHSTACLPSQWVLNFDYYVFNLENSNYYCWNLLFLSFSVPDQ